MVLLFEAYFMKKIVQYTIPVTSEEQFIEIKKIYDRHTKIFFNCCDCHKPVVLLLRKMKTWPGKCRVCKIEDTNIIRYGTKYQTQCDNFKTKKLKTQNGIWLTEKAKNNMKKTKKEKYNDEYYTNREKSSITFKNHKQNDENFIEKMKEKMKKTCRTKYNVDWYRQSEEYDKAIKITNNKKFNSDYYFSSEIGKNNIKNTMIERYGVEHALQCKEIRDKTKKKYTYNGINFDSSWEIAFYIYLSDHNVRFEYHPIDFDYYCPIDNKKHKYELDFKLFNNTFIEIKGGHLLEKMKTDVNSKEHYKYLCMLENNVKIITDCSKYLDYINETYGKQYLSRFKNHK